MIGWPLFLTCVLDLWRAVTAEGIIIQEGGSDWESARSIVLAGGLPVVTGYSDGAIPGMTNAGSNDGFVVKYNMDGTQAAIKSFGTTDDDQIYCSAVDGSDNVFVVGATEGTLSGSNAGEYDLFIAKLDSTLGQVWLVQTGTTVTEYARAIAIDSSGNIVVGGYTYGTWSGQTALGETDAFLMKYDSSGTRQWVIQFGSTTWESLYGIAVDMVDSVNDILATGYTYGNFEGNTLSGLPDVFLIKVRSDGTKDWSVQVGTTSSSASAHAYQVVVDSARNAYVSGYTNGRFTTTSSLGSDDAFLMKFDKDGVQQWVIQMGTASSDRSHDLSIDANQYIYPVMLTEGSMEGSNLGARDIALLQVDSSGTILSTDQFGTTGDEELPTSGGVVAVDPAGNLFITGVTDGAFNGYTNAGGYDLFVYKIDAKSTSTSTSTYSSNLAAVAKCEENAGAFSENKRKIS